MSKKANAGWIFKKWAASLTEKDLKYDSISSNFDELFYELSTLGLKFEDAEQYIDMAVSSHAPSLSVIKRVYQQAPSWQRSSSTLEEYSAQWISRIKDKAIVSFGNFFDQDEPLPNQGSMSAREYVAARKYTESFPTINMDEVPEINVDDLFDLGDIDD
jgi:hypothetical protein